MFDKKGVIWFLGLTFSLTWLVDLAIYLTVDYEALAATGAKSLHMLMPAFSATLLGLFFFPTSPIYYKRHPGRARWFYYFFLLFILLVFPIGLSNLLAPTNQTLIHVVASIVPLMSILILLLIAVLRFTQGQQAMARVWLAWGSWRNWLLFSLALAAYYALMTALNMIFGLGPTNMTPFPTPEGFNPIVYTSLSAVGLLLFGSVLSFGVGFGEEYGWRGYLQSELFKLGRVRGVLLLGVIWGVWHWPIILMGHTYPGHPLIGMLIFLIMGICLSIVFGYAVLRSGSVLLAAFLHSLNNVSYSQILNVGLLPFDNAFSFIGIYGVVPMVIIALLILRDPIWRGAGGNLAQPEPAPAVMTLSENSGAVEKPAD
jgi:membrane protease YdiL (CAAX protease family)